MILFPTAKINIGLYVCGKRPDGFHNIETLFYPVTPENSNLKSDILEILPRTGNMLKMRIVQSGIEYPGKPEENLCVKAYNILDKAVKRRAASACSSADCSKAAALRNGLPPVVLYLRKQIPVGAGLGGGSADATATLSGLNKIFELGFSIEELATMAAQLGSDCPFFLYNMPMLAKGRGEILSTADSGMLADFNSHYRIKIIFPDCFISTAYAYSLVRERVAATGSLENLLKLPIESWNGKIINDFEAPIFKEHPGLATIKQQLLDEGALYASMSGSGSAIYGIFKR